MKLYIFHIINNFYSQDFYSLNEKIKKSTSQCEVESLLIYSLNQGYQGNFQEKVGR